MDRWRKLHGRRLDHEERTRKKAAREGHKASEDAQKLTGLRAKLYQKKRHHEKIQMKKQIKAHEERNVKSSAPNEPSSTPLPQYLLDRSNPTSAKALSSAIKNKRSEKAARFSVPLPKVKGISEQEMFKVVKVCRRNFFTSDTGSSSGTRSINLMEDHATVGGSSGVDILARQYLAILRLHPTGFLTLLVNFVKGEFQLTNIHQTGKKTAKKGWKRMITKPTFVGPGTYTSF